MMEVQAYLRKESWPVKIRPLRAKGNYVVSGRGTEMWIAVRPSGGIGGGDFLVAVTNFNRCGCLDARKWSAGDVQQYIGIENLVDAVTLAAALDAIFKMEEGKLVAMK
ncbi:hypothetical protein [Desulfofundulus salinus]|jgi:hypothetical protein|uniref:Uncharacterized protein n=1 Tax=Desulfofundulus salinus TaxID=2419843 RepID=A0A494WUF3_9FIRM|nr:hypothetical protein [Desulfofundulus salinum]RKO65742.1 hypothetical protein D7024_01340 [Desulfofundulus salinum]